MNMIDRWDNNKKSKRIRILYRIRQIPCHFYPTTSCTTYCAFTAQSTLNYFRQIIHINQNTLLLLFTTTITTTPETYNHDTPNRSRVVPSSIRVGFCLYNRRPTIVFRRRLDHKIEYPVGRYRLPLRFRRQQQQQ